MSTIKRVLTALTLALSATFNLSNVYAQNPNNKESGPLDLVSMALRDCEREDIKAQSKISQQIHQQISIGDEEAHRQYSMTDSNHYPKDFLGVFERLLFNEVDKDFARFRYPIGTLWYTSLDDKGHPNIENRELYDEYRLTRDWFKRNSKKALRETLKYYLGIGNNPDLDSPEVKASINLNNLDLNYEDIRALRLRIRTLIDHKEYDRLKASVDWDGSVKIRSYHPIIHRDRADLFLGAEVQTDDFFDGFGDFEQYKIGIAYLSKKCRVDLGVTKDKDEQVYGFVVKTRF